MEYSYKLQKSIGLDQRLQKSQALWRVWLQRYKTRKQLHALLLDEPDRLHHDLGISSEAALVEINKTFWQR